MTRRLMGEAVRVSVEDWGRVHWNLFSRLAHPNKSLDPIRPARGQRVSSTVRRQSVEFCWMTIYSVADWMQLSSSFHLQRFLHRQKNRMGRDTWLRFNSSPTVCSVFRHSNRLLPYPSNAAASAWTRCTGFRSEKSLIWWRQLVPEATMVVSAEAARTAGISRSSAMVRLTS